MPVSSPPQRLHASGRPEDHNSVRQETADAAYQFVNRTRIIQKTSRTTGTNWGRKKYHGTENGPGSNRGNPLVKADPAANPTPRHMRHKCRAMRGAPAMPPVAMTLMSESAAITRIDVKA